MRVGLRHKRRGRVAVAVGTLVACGAVAVAGASGAAQNAKVEATASSLWDPADVTGVVTGDTVTWEFDQGGSLPHNVKGGCPPGEDPSCVPGPAEDPAWPSFASPLPSTEPASYRFTKPGTYTFFCVAHPGTMVGTVEVTGDPVEPTPTATPTATPTVTATATATPTATPTPTPDDHTTTPPPGAVSASDATAPALTSLRASGKRGVAKLRFRLSETATVTVRIKRGTTVVRTARLQVRAGTRTLTVRTTKLKRGKKYRVELQARDARGNTSALAGADLRIKRK